MKLSPAMLTVLAWAAPVVAYARPVTGLHSGAGAGVNWIGSHSTIDLSGQTIPGNFGLPPNVTVNDAGKANFHTGWTGVVSLGWRFGNGFRAGIEGNYRSSEVDSIRGFGIAPLVEPAAGKPPPASS